MNWLLSFLDHTFMVIILVIFVGTLIAFAKTLNRIYKPFETLHQELQNKYFK
ncbi:hypothetical protein [Priestia megaterium]|uniref:hypothetical protein n=1 Tax=Priestia megaterium TaxID=1404 RepID=UPI002782D588|nr:hypothetical protein [Priestia megaterium]MDQ0808049.1 uncharacterized protein YpmB [Priestia megaterium]